MNKHTATAPNGQTFTRNSKGRTYSHAILALHSEARSLRNVDAPGHTKIDRGAYEYLSRDVWHSNGFTYGAYGKGPALALGRRFKDAAAFLAAFPTEAEFLAARRAERLADHEQAVADGEFDQWVCLGWTGRPDLADKKVLSETASGRYSRVIAAPATIA
jgi:hypothetical protein